MLSLALLFAATAAAQSVTLPGGTLQGGKCTTSNASYFYSVPFAQPPTGNLRFAPPQSYNGTLGQATTPSPKCPQFGLEFIEYPYQEDCLYLDIWVPPNANNLPVKVWLFGGGNTAGSITNPTYNGCNLATDSVVVSVNYRLGPLGFLGLQSFGIAGNMGIQDQLLGLNWVKENIQAFGGDPSKVVLFGESAGASDTYVIGTLPQTPSLIQAGISESGGGRGLPSSAAANSFGARWASSLNCSDAACLRSLSIQQLNVTLPKPTGPTVNINSVSGFGAFIDGQTIPADPAVVGVQVPFIFGSNTMEGTLLILSLPTVSGPQSITPAVYQAYLNSTFGSAAPLVAAKYPVSAFNSTPFPAFYALVQVYTETNFWCPAYAGLNKAASKGVPVWTYRWGQAPSCPWYNVFGADVLPIFGASHTAEIPFVFANVDNNPPPNGNCNFTDAEKSLSREMVGFWTGMAASGNPGNGWPQYSMSTSAGINVVNGSSMVTPGVVDYSVCSFWGQVGAVAAGNSSTSPAATSSSAGGSPPVATYASAAKPLGVKLPFVLGMVGVLVTLVFSM